MNRYKPSTPRVSIGIVALAMTAITLELLIVFPSRMETDSQTFTAFTAKAHRSEATRAVVNPSCIDVVDTRERRTALNPRRVSPAPKQHA